MSSTGMTEEVKPAAKKKLEPASKEQVLAYLKRHPEFLIENPDLVEVLKAPKTERGSGVADLQHYMVGGLQKELQVLRGKYDDIVDYCRDNMSTQSQVHQAILGLIRARDLEQLLQVITVDLVSLFDVDVVRLAMETDGAALYETSYPDAHYSGISFIETGTVDVVMGEDSDILLNGDTEKSEPIAFEEIFSDCVSLVKSCAMLRLHLETVNKQVLLCFGVRHKGRFHANQGVDLLAFLAEIVELRLDTCLAEMDPEALA